MIGGLSSRREQMILVAVVILGLALVVQRGVLFPLKEWRGGLEGRIERAQLKLKKSSQVASRSRAYEKQFSSLLDIYRQRGSDEQAMSGLLSEIDQATQGVNVQVLEMKPLKGRKTDLSVEFKVDISLEGNLTDILQYVHRLQVSPHLFHVDELKLERKSMMGDGLRCRLVLRRILIQG